MRTHPFTYCCLLKLLIFSMHQLHAQPAPSLFDSIRTSLYAAHPDTSKYYLLLKLAQLPDCPPDTLLLYGQHWLNYTNKTMIKQGKPEALYAIGISLYRKGMNKEASKSLFEAAIHWEKANNNTLQLARTYELIAGIHKTMQQNSSALHYYRQALVLKRSLHNEQLLLSTYNGLGNMLRLMKQTDSAVFYLQKAYALAGTNEVAKAQVSLNLGNIYWSLQNASVAKTWYEKSLHSFESLEQAEGIAEASFNLGAVASKLSQYPVAINYYNKSLQALPVGQPVEHLEWIYEHLADAYYHTGLFERAYLNEVAYLAIKDSLQPLQVQQSIAGLKEKFEVEKKEHALELEKERTGRLQVVNRQQSRLLITLASVAILISIMGYLIIRNVRRKQLLAAELATLKEKEKQQLIKEQALKSNIAMLEGREGERQRIARDLHDRLGSTFSTMRLFMQNASKSSTTTDNKLLILLEEAVNDVRRISHDLSDNILVKYGLDEALLDMKDTIEATSKLKVNLYQQPILHLTPSIAAEIYYIVRELVANTVKHSGADNVYIQLMTENDLLYLTVEDNGRGFDAALVATGIGLYNIETRAQKLRAEYRMDAHPGKGSCFSFAIPLT